MMQITVLLLRASFVIFWIIILNIYYENYEIIKIAVVQTSKISQLERIVSKFPSKQEIGIELLLRRNSSWVALM